MKDASTIKITGVIFKNDNRYIHDSVYATAGLMNEFKDLLEQDKDTSWLFGMLDFNLSDERMTEYAARAAFIYRKTKSNISAIHNMLANDGDRCLPVPFPDQKIDLSSCRLPTLTEKDRLKYMKLLRSMFDCTPNQGVGTNIPEDTEAVAGKDGTVKPKSNQRTCDQYRLCPWCRYEKAFHIFNQLNAKMGFDMDFWVTHFLTPCDSRQLDVNSNEKTYKAVTRNWIESTKRDCDYFITLPRRIQTSSWQDGEPDRYNLAWRTSIIALLPKSPPPTGLEYAMPKNTKNCTFMSDGLWQRYPATKKGLGAIFKTIMGYPIEMLVNNHDENFVLDVLTVLTANNSSRAVDHGIRTFKKTITPDSPAQQVPRDPAA